MVQCLMKLLQELRGQPGCFCHLQSDLGVSRSWAVETWPFPAKAPCALSTSTYNYYDILHLLLLLLRLVIASFHDY